jgi:hypothetical protein
MIYVVFNESFPLKYTSSNSPSCVVDVVDIITLAKVTSTNGKKLTREVLKWHKHEKNKSILKNKSLKGQLKMN